MNAVMIACHGTAFVYYNSWSITITNQGPDDEQYQVADVNVIGSSLLFTVSNVQAYTDTAAMKV